MNNFFRRFLCVAAAAVLCCFFSACGSVASEAETVSLPPSLSLSPALTTPAPVPAPYIELPGGMQIECLCGRPFTDPGFRAYDADGADLSSCVAISGEVVCWKVGHYALNYELIVDGQPLAEAVRTVCVVPNTLPETIRPEKVTYLTFDDGPCKDTPELLDVLAKYGAKATFFIIGNHAEEDLEILPRIVEEGHALGIHAYWHEYGHLYSNQENFFEDFMAVQELIYRYTGAYATLYRFPGSSRTASYLKGDLDNGYETLSQMLHDMGVRFYDWSVQIEDSQTGVEGTFLNFKSGVPAADIPIVLQHDTRAYSVHTVERMLQWGLEKGYFFCALDTTVPEIHFFQDR